MVEREKRIKVTAFSKLILYDEGICFLLKIRIPDNPITTNAMEINSAWVGCRPNIEYVELTRMVSIKKRSIPFNIR